MQPHPAPDAEPEAGEVRLLPDALANQIAAGEVVERPASVVKELVENALDAQATRILVDVEGAGKILIRVVDDGLGMTPGDAERSLLRHATSKVRTSEDLESISTLGFRGEALPSIASVSRFLLVTRQEGHEAATTVSVEGGAKPIVDVGAAPVGTRIEVRDLFWNVPARLKFLKSDHTETQHVIDLMKAFALGHPHVHFRLGTGGRSPALDFAPVRRLYERVGQVLGRESAQSLYEISYASALIRVSGFISTAKAARSSPAGMTCFVNGRRVKDRVIHHAIVSAYGTELGPGRFPQAVVWIHIDPREVDVNVHPAKAEVRFRAPDQVHAAVAAAIQATLRARPWLEETPLEAYTNRAPTQLHLGEEGAPPTEAKQALAPQQPALAPEVLSPKQRPSLTPIMPWQREALAKDNHPSPLSPSTTSRPPSEASEAAPSLSPSSALEAPPPQAAKTPTSAASATTLTPEHESETHTTRLSFGEKPKALFDEGLGEATPVEAPRKSQQHSPFEARPRENPKVPPASKAFTAPSPQVARVYQAPPAPPRQPAKYLGQSHHGMVLAEDADGLYLVDTLAALALLTEVQLETLVKPVTPQNLLLPGRLDVAAHEAKALEARLEELQQLGVWIEPFGSGTFQLLGLPTPLLRASPVRVLSHLTQLLGRQPEAPLPLLVRELAKALSQSGDVNVLINGLYSSPQGFIQEALKLPAERKDSRNRRAYTLLSTSELERRLTT